MEFKHIATNKKAYRDFFLLDKWECGMHLTGGEVKSLRAAQVSFADSFVRMEEGEAYLYSLHIAPYMQASYLNDDPDRRRKLLLHKREIEKIAALVDKKKYALVPTRIYFNPRGLAKVEIALGKGKKFYDKREDIKRRDLDRDMKRSSRGK